MKVYVTLEVEAIEGVSLAKAADYWNGWTPLGIVRTVRVADSIDTERPDQTQTIQDDQLVELPIDEVGGRTQI